MTTMPKARRSVNPGPATLHDCECLQRPIAPCELIRDGRAGCVRINGTPCFVAYNATRSKGEAAVIYGYTITTPAGMRYDLTQSSCDCPDATYRGRECKHLQAIRRMLADGDLAEITPVVPVVPMFEDP